MKVTCRTNELSDALLTGIHRTILARYFEYPLPLRWNAVLGGNSTVYAVVVMRGYPFYFVKRTVEHDDWGLIPSLCFDIVDDRPSRYWRFQSEVVGDGRDQYVRTTLAFAEWFEPTFRYNLCEERKAEVTRMRRIAAKMDGEFERNAPAWRWPIGSSRSC